MRRSFSFTQVKQVKSYETLKLGHFAHWGQRQRDVVNEESERCNFADFENWVRAPRVKGMREVSRSSSCVPRKEHKSENALMLDQLKPHQTLRPPKP